jgi:hypothetical protein
MSSRKYSLNCPIFVYSQVEWQLLKIIVKSQHYPRVDMNELWKLIATYHRDEFPNLIYLAQIALTHPIHTAYCERSFSAQNNITTYLRNRISEDNCDKLKKEMILTNLILILHLSNGEMKIRVIVNQSCQQVLK